MAGIDAPEEEHSLFGAVWSDMEAIPRQMNKAETETQFHENLKRVQNLIDIYEEKLTSGGQGRRPVGSADVLRAAVVLLHATLEDFVRNISRELLPKQAETVLNNVPLWGTGAHGKAEKFFLGKLVQFRGKTVDDVLSESVDEFLERSNYNKPDDLASAIENAGLDKTQVTSFFTDLKELMERRHWIVHRADRNTQMGRGHHKGKSIGIQCVTRWVTTVEAFVNEILRQLA